MRYLKFTYVDAVTGVSITDAPASNGPVFPAVEGLEFVWARESRYPADVPEFFGTCPDGSDVAVPGVLGEYIEADWQTMRDDEIRARPGSDVAATIAARRYQAEIKGFAWNGYFIATDRESQAKIDTEDRAIDRGLRTDGKGWKCIDLTTNQIVFRSTTNVEMRDLAAAAYNYVRSCFAREEELLNQLASGTYTADMLEQGWPAQQVA